MNTIPGMGALEQAAARARLAAVRHGRAAGRQRPQAGAGRLRPAGGGPHDRDVPRRPRVPAARVPQVRPVALRQDSPALPAVAALGPDATQAVFSNRTRTTRQKGWHPVIGPFFNRGLMLLDFDEHMYHRRIMQEAFTRTRLSGYVEHIDRVASKVDRQRLGRQRRAVPVLPGDEGTDPRHRLGGVHGPRTRHRPRTGDQGQPGLHHHDARRRRDHPHAASRRSRGGAVCRPARCWRTTSTSGSRKRRNAEGTDMLTVLCHTDGRGRQQVLRRRHRQPHDLPDDGRTRHLDLDADHDGLSPGRQPGVAGALPRRVRPARRRPAGHRGAGEAGDPRPGDQRVAAAGHAAAVQRAPGRPRHRAAGLLHPGRHQRHTSGPA